MNYNKLIDDIIQKYNACDSIEIVYNKLLELEEIEEKSYDEYKFIYYNFAYIINKLSNNQS